MYSNTQLSHDYDIHLQALEGVDLIDNTVFNACEAELQSRSTSDCDGGGDDGGFDSAGTLGTLKVPGSGRRARVLLKHLESN